MPPTRKAKKPKLVLPKTFLINLDRRPDRLKTTDALFRRLGINYERISAFDAKAQKRISGVDWWRAYLYDNFQPPLLGHIGVYFSHRMAWQRIVDLGLPQAAVFEDDIEENTYDPAFMKLDLKSIGVELLRLEGFPAIFNPSISQVVESVPLEVKGRLVNFEPSYGAASYLITLEGAKKCLSLEKFWFNVDHFDMLSEFTGVKTGLLVPTMFKQLPSPSDTVHSPRADMAPVHDSKAKHYQARSVYDKIIELVALKSRLIFVLPWHLRQLFRRKLLKEYVANYASRLAKQGKGH